MNKFLENERIKEVIYTVRSGKEQIVFKYPNLTQKRYIKDMLDKNKERIIKNNFTLTHEVEIYRYIMKNLCGMDGLEDYSDIELMNLLNQKRNVKILRTKMENLTYELFEEVLNEQEKELEILNITLKIIDNNNKEKNIEDLMYKVFKDNGIDITNVDDRELTLTKIKELSDKIKNNNKDK